MTATQERNCQCTRCRFKHRHADRVGVDTKDGLTQLVCPRCRCTSFYDIKPQVAWCWASGLIEIGDESQRPGSAIQIARGPKAHLEGVLSVLARRGRGASEGSLLVPGIPEAPDCQAARGDVLAKWLKWCAQGNGRSGRYGVEFAEMVE